MNRIFKGAVLAAGSLGLLGGLMAAALPAGAITGNEAYGVTATGPVTLAPVAVATTGNTPAVASNVNLPGLLSTGMILDRADAAKASSIISQPIVLTVSSAVWLDATGVRAWCHLFGGSVYRGADIFGGSITFVGEHGNPRTVVPLPTEPAPNTVITLPHGAGTLTLNKQTTTTGTTTTDAIYAALTGGQTVTLGVAACSLPT